MLQTTLTDHPQRLKTISEEYDDRFPANWWVVFPKSTQLDLADEDRANACFEHETHADKFADTWGQFVEIIKNGAP